MARASESRRRRPEAASKPILPSRGGHAQPRRNPAPRPTARAIDGSAVHGDAAALRAALPGLSSFTYDSCSAAPADCDGHEDWGDACGHTCGCGSLAPGPAVGNTDAACCTCAALDHGTCPVADHAIQPPCACDGGWVGEQCDQECNGHGHSAAGAAPAAAAALLSDTTAVAEAVTASADACAGGIDASGSGAIAIGSYPDNADCTWAISCADPAAQVGLAFASFDTEGNFDFVTVYDGGSTDAPRIGEKLSGGSPPPPQLSSGPAMLVRLTSDGSTSGSGFSAGFVCGSPACTCDPAFSGDLCDTCSPAFSGDLCDTFHPCFSVDCHGHGTCDEAERPVTVRNPPAVCTCNPAFSGDLCDTFGPCFGADCHGHGTCDEAERPATTSDSVDFTVCTCSGNWAGDRCERDLCASVSCGENGGCVRGECACVPGWAGMHCEGDWCLPHGKRVLGGEACVCERGFSGRLCTIDDCATIDCGRQGRCASGACACTNGFRGDRCEIDPCLPHGAFAEQAGCMCTPAYSSELCDVFEPCFDVDCGDHGATCDAQPRPASPKDTAAICACDKGWEGDRCEVDKCTTIDCGTNGVCNRGVRNAAIVIMRPSRIGLGPPRPPQC